MRTIAPVGPGAAPVLARLHARAFETPWSAAELASTLTSPGAFALTAAGRGADAPPAGFILARAIAGEAEVLTLAVDPDQRRGGLGRALVEAAAALAGQAGAEVLWLEVAADNTGALALYAACGFHACGRRPGYYPRVGGAVDALMLQRPLNTAPA